MKLGRIKAVVRRGWGPATNPMVARIGVGSEERPTAMTSEFRSVRSELIRGSGMDILGEAIGSREWPERAVVDDHGCNQS